MTVPTGDSTYADTEAPLTDVVARLVKGTAEPMPIVVWLYRGSEEEATDACDAHLRGDEEASLALERFRRYRVDVETLTSRSLREEYRGTPAYVFFDPAGTEVSRVEGKRASDCRSFGRALARAWRETYRDRLRRYAKAMDEILDEKEKISDRRARAEAEWTELAERPNPRKERALQRVSREIESDLEKLLEKEREIRSALTLRKEFKEGAEELAETR
jgi:hypothetical protein